jgi:hypothetical protein
MPILNYTTTVSAECSKDTKRLSGLVGPRLQP